MKDGKKCVLIADDEKSIRDILTLLLTGEGYIVLAAEDGQQAEYVLIKHKTHSDQKYIGGQDNQPGIFFYPAPFLLAGDHRNQKG